jgi:hypothetical protein
MGDVDPPRHEHAEVMQLAVVGTTTGLMVSDHRQPGCKVARPTVAPPPFTPSTVFLSGLRVSSGDSKLPFPTPAITAPLLQSDSDP